MNRKAHTYDQAAEQLGVSGETIRQLVNAGELLPFYVTSHAHGRAVRISDIELDRFIAAREDAQRQKHAHLTFGNTAQSRA
ncbi:helix-turn-helix domain-containing protein [Deinococcus yunweiensis]|uniref:helix-turn-helix domain-containing protein n=1 Tax=Deinococcus yunweiensis TaxID=367282 RepID=UPI00398F18CF